MAKEKSLANKSQSPYAIDIRELMIFMAFSVISCPPNYLWQTWLEASFPGYAESLSSSEKEKLMDDTVVGKSTTTSSEKPGLRSRNGEKGAITAASSPSPDKVKKKLSIRNTIVKFLLDQSIGAAVNTVMFIMGIAMLRGQSLEAGWEETKTGFWPLVFAGQKLWPLVSIISLTLVPVEQRMVFGSIIGVGWGIFLSLVGSKSKQKTE